MNHESMTTRMHLLKWHGDGHLQVAETQGKTCLLVETQRKLVSWIVTEKKQATGWMRDGKEGVMPILTIIMVIRKSGT